MRFRRKGSWWGLYLLAPLTVGLLYVTARMHVGRSLHLVLLLAIIIGVPVLALLWTENHVDLMRTEGVNVQAEEQALAASGVDVDRLAPPLTARQADYRRIMLAAPPIDETRDCM